MKIIIDIPGYPAGLAALRSLGIEAICLDCPDAFDGESPSRDLDLALVGDAEGLICSYPPTNLAEMRALRWIQVASTGFTQLVGLGLAERGIRATNARGCLDHPSCGMEPCRDGEPGPQPSPNDPQPGRGGLGPGRSFPE